MATTTEGSTLPVEPRQPPTFVLPQYPDMIMAAIEELNDNNGSSKTAISRQIEATHPDLPPAHVTLLSHHLDKMKQAGQLILVKNNYLKPDPNAPPRRGRGRPPKPRDPNAPPTATAASSPRPRGRPPKPRDPFAPPSNLKTPSGTGRPRGRPPKRAKTEDGAVPEGAAAPSVSPRGRGRPPKVKPAVAPVSG